jgi:hypothetical protein
MVQSILPFEKVGKSGLAGFSNRLGQVCPRKAAFFRSGFKLDDPSILSDCPDGRNMAVESKYVLIFLNQGVFFILCLLCIDPAHALPALHNTHAFRRQAQCAHTY